MTAWQFFLLDLFLYDTHAGVIISCYGAVIKSITAIFIEKHANLV